MDSVNGKISLNPNDQCRLCLFYLSKRKDGEGDRSFEVLAQNLQKVGFEMVKCDKHSSLVFSIRDAHLHKVKGQLNSSAYGTEFINGKMSSFVDSIIHS